MIYYENYNAMINDTDHDVATLAKIERINACLAELGIALVVPADIIDVKSIMYNEQGQETVFELENGATLTMDWQGYIGSTDGCEYEEIQRKNSDGTLETIGFVRED